MSFRVQARTGSGFGLEAEEGMSVRVLTKIDIQTHDCSVCQVIRITSSSSEKVLSRKTHS